MGNVKQTLAILSGIISTQRIDADTLIDTPAWVVNGTENQRWCNGECHKAQGLHMRSPALW